MKYVLGNDPKPIMALYGEQGEWSARVGSMGITKISAYLEDGDAPWFAVYKGEEITSRINSRYVETVSYDKNSI